MPAKISIVGKTFGRLKVISEAEAKVFNCGQRRIRYNCLCDCGRASIVYGSLLIMGHTKSCGCLRKDNHVLSHGHALYRNHSRTYRIWCNMKERCNRTAHKFYYRYGGRGIKVCERWNSFREFLKDMGEAPARLSLERRNNDGNYEPSNCYWATQKQQCRNQVTNRIVTIRGITGCLAELAERFNVSYNLVRDRILRGWAPERAFFEPKHQR